MKSALYKVLKSRHFWRYATFSEIAELYISRMIKAIAMNIFAGFTSVYLYEQGYSLQLIMTFWLCYYLFKVSISFLAGRSVAFFGPKHTILISSLMYVPAMVFLGMMSILGVWGVVLWGFFMAIATTLYGIAFMVDFSKIKNIEHAGKEIAFMNILDKIAIGISPVIGGAIALFYGLNAVIWIAAILFTISAIPLFRTIEPVMTRRKLNMNGFPWRTTFRSLVSSSAVGFDYVTTGGIWSLFIVIAIFPSVGADVYIKLGALSSVTIIAAIVASYTYGKVIDRKKGGELLKISVVANAIVHISRAFATTIPSIIFTNITNEVATMGYSMSFTRGLLDTADISGNRTIYMTLHSVFSNFGAAIACATLIALTILFGNINGMKLFFVVAACAVIVIGSAKFRMYRK